MPASMTDRASGAQADETRAQSLARDRTWEGGRCVSLLPKLNAAVQCLEALQRVMAHQLAQKLLVSAPARWLYENHFYLLKNARALRPELTRLERTPLPQLRNGPLLGYPRVYEISTVLASELSFVVSESGAAQFIHQYQSIATLKLGELWAIEPMLKLALIEELGRSASLIFTAGEANLQVLPEFVENCVRGLTALAKFYWREFVDDTSRVEEILREDPANAYLKMDFDTRDDYRHAVEEIARRSSADEEQVARAAIQFARDAARRETPLVRATHVGYHLIGEGADQLKSTLHYRPSLSILVQQTVRKYPSAFYLIGIEALTLLIAAQVLSYLPAHLHQVALIVFLLATEASLMFMNQLVTRLLPPRRLPKLDFSEGIPNHCGTMVVVPTILISEDFIATLLRSLEVRYLANRDPQLNFALLTDFKDAPQREANDAHLAHVCAEGIGVLNRRYAHHGRQPFYLFHRRREWNAQQGTWMGWERKRGKLIALNRLLLGLEDTFHLKVGDMARLRGIRYVITLDSDTELPRDVAHRLVGTMEHPLNRPVVDPHTKMVTKGYGILQPRVGVSVHSARRSRLATIYSGQTGFDIYTTAASDVYQDLFGEGSYVGKGIYDLEAFETALGNRFPHNVLLSHDLIEGAYARAGLVSDIEVIDEYPSHYSAWSRRKHRWVRGDWQILRWLLPRVPDSDGHLVPNPLSVLSLWKIVDNLRRSLIEIALFILLIAGWTVLPGGPAYWTAAVLLVTFLPVYIQLFFSLLQFPTTDAFRLFAWQIWGRNLLAAFVSGHVEVLFRLTFLAHQTCLMLDAILRTLIRILLTQVRLLEWESAAQSELAGRMKLIGSIELYIWLAMPLSVVCGLAIALVNRGALPYAWPLLVLWWLSPFLAMWLNSSAPHRRETVRACDQEFLLEVAKRTWGFFDRFSTAGENWLIPDNVLEDPPFRAHRISPTNMGFLANAQLAAFDLKFISREQLAQRLERIFESFGKMETFRGHFFNWYSTESLQPLPPRYISTVDSGNLAACLITLESACIELNLPSLASRAGSMWQQMDFSFLLNPKSKLLHIGYNADGEVLDDSYYDLLASEARLASFIAIAKNDAPQENWIRLGRALTKEAGHRILLSWSGTMFEYLMPQLWLQSWPDTLLDRSAHAVVRCQQAYAKRKAIPWGTSESACAEPLPDSEFRYHAWGIPAIALRQDDPERLVASPYAAALALLTFPREASDNLKHQAERGWLGEFGFYEAADFTDGTTEKLVRGYMAHHQGMILLALDSALNGRPMQRRFHSSPYIESAEFLLQERLRFATLVKKESKTNCKMQVPEP